MPPEGPRLHFGNVLIFHRIPLFLPAFVSLLSLFLHCEKMSGKAPFLRDVRIQVRIDFMQREIQPNEQAG